MAGPQSTVVPPSLSTHIRERADSTSVCAKDARGSHTVECIFAFAKREMVLFFFFRFVSLFEVGEEEKERGRQSLKQTPR